MAKGHCCSDIMPCHDGVVALGFLGRRCYGVRAVVQHKRRTGYSAAAVAARRRPVAAAALVWSLASAPFYVVLQLSDEVRRPPAAAGGAAAAVAVELLQPSSLRMSSKLEQKL